MTTTWRDHILTHCPVAGFSAPASRASIAEAERLLGLGPELPVLLSETDGVQGEYGMGLIWSVSRIMAENRAFRSNGDFQSLYMPFDHLVFFADAGNGDQFALAVRGGGIRSPDVFAWNHEDDSRSWVAPDIRKYLEWWMAGKIKT